MSEIERAEVEVTEVERVPMEDLVESTEKTSGGKGKLIGLAVAGVAAVAVGAVALFHKHKKSKAAEQEAEEDFDDEFYYDEEIDDDFDRGDVAAEKDVEEPEN